jgi:hypothetical protein
MGTVPSATGSTARQYLSSVWANCLDSFKSDPRFNADAFGTLLAGGMKWLNLGDPGIGATPVDVYSHDGDTRPISALFANGDNAVVLPGTNVVVVSPNYYSDLTQTEQVAVAVHEALHIVTYSWGYTTDIDLGEWLMNFGFSPSKRFSSGEITDWIVGTSDHMSTTGGGCKNP